MSKTEPALPSAEDLDTRLSLIQALIPIGLAAVAEALQSEVEALCGSRYTRKEEETPNRRWGSQGGSGYLADQKGVPVVIGQKTSIFLLSHCQR